LKGLLVLEYVFQADHTIRWLFKNAVDKAFEKWRLSG